jgi:methylmalonyl-CoA/ethylmalonyl-CoA epimerase
MTGPAIGITRIGQIALRVDDLAEAVRFYRDVLGLTLLFEAPPGMAFFDCNGTRIMLSLPEAAGDGGPASVVYYTVPDIQGSARALTEGGAVLEREPHLVARLPHADVWMAFLRDPSRNVLALMSEVSRASSPSDV